MWHRAKTLYTLNRPLLTTSFLGPLLLSLCLSYDRITEAQTNSASARLAIIAEHPSASQTADLLTSATSTIPGLVLLERGEIARVYKEQELSAANKNPVKLGKILGADGLVILSVLAEGTNQFLLERLVAVKPGVIIDSVRSPWPLADQVHWAEWLARRFEPLAQKLKVQAKDAVPISIVNVRSAIETAEGRDAEASLKLLTLERLGRERSVFVLERQRMELLPEETSLEGIDESSFWSGSYLLDAVVDNNGYSKEVITISARLTPASGDKPQLFELKASRTNLTDLTEQLVGKITESLRLGPPRSAWAPAEEAGKYFEEAKWAYKWNIFAEASRACEASWALGNKSKEVAALRIGCYLHSGVDTAPSSIYVEQRLVNFPNSPPDTTRFAVNRRGMELFCNDFRTFVASDPAADWNWYELGIDLLESSAMWLRHYYFKPEAREGQELSLSEARARAREISSVLGQHPAYTNRFGRKNLVATRAACGAFWTEGPDQGVQIYREILEAGYLPQVRTRFLQSDISAPCLIGWNWTERRRAQSVWQGFIQEVCATKTPLTVLEGLFMRTAYSRSDEEYEANFKSMLESLTKNRDQLIANKLDEALVRDIGNLAEAKCDPLKPRPIPLLVRDSLWKTAKQSLFDYRMEYAKSNREGDRRSYLDGGTYDFKTFSELFFYNADYREAEARVLLSKLAPYRSNLTAQADALLKSGMAANSSALPPAEKAKQSSDMTRRRMELMGAAGQLNRLEQLLKSKLPADAAATSQATPPPPVASARTEAVVPGGNPAGPRSVPQATAPGSGFNRGVDPESLTLTNPLQVTRFWAVPTSSLGASSPHDISMFGWYFRGGRLWVEVRFNEKTPELQVHNIGAIFSIDLSSLKSEVINLDPDSFHLPLRPSHGVFSQTFRSFDLLNDWLYVNTLNQVRRYSLKTRTWEALPAPIEGYARISIVDGHVYLSTDDTILEISADGKETKVLASRRRRPALTVLDSLEPYDNTPIIKGEDGSIVCFMGKQKGCFYSRKPQADDWTLVACLDDPQWCSVFDDCFIAKFGSQRGGDALFKLSSRSRSPELLLAQPPLFQMPIPQPRATTNTPQWPLPGNVRAIEYPCCPDGEQLWIFASSLAFERGENNHPRLKEIAGRHGILFNLSPGQDSPALIPLWLRLPSDLLQNSSPLLSYGPGSDQGVLLLATPHGLVLTLRELPGFWFIPRRELADWASENASKSAGGKNPSAQDGPKPR